MKPQIALTHDQMAELKSLGLDCSDASMCWCKEPNEDEYRLFIHDEYCYEAACLNPVPAYTLEDIISKLPMKIDWVPRNGKPMKWQSYRFDKYFHADTPLDAAFTMLKYAIKNYPDKIKML